MTKQSFSELLLSDLRLLEFPPNYAFFMPENVLERHKETLKGPYIVQINDMKDVGSSLLTQIEKLQNEKLQNEKQAMPISQHRLLKFTLTDGRQTFLGMEYAHLEELDEHVSMGAKVKSSPFV
jgi:hypothetical protein